MLQRTATFHISDLEIIRFCSKHTAESVEFPNFCVTLFQHASRVAISPRFSPALYRALEPTGDYASPKPEIEIMANDWRMLGSDLARMPNITKLTLWFDHDEPFRWAHVHERALLSPLTTLLSNKRIDFHVSLPNLHPDSEDADRHFTAGASTPFLLVRRPRQWHDRGHLCNDISTMSRERDLAIIVEMWHYLAEVSQYDFSRSRLEQDECLYWKSGEFIEVIAEEWRILSEWNTYVSYSI